ncbi:MAG TPA: M13 family metallopeptidase N-terminal domain-containing protein, partial [Gemmatimonadaceae bacterium]|nr:M13 family metallopeptidase N-terminal domain-containing protein [Gemmatimonadaceae bacterium]
MIQRIRPIVIPFVLGAVISAVLAMPAAAQMTSGIDTANFDHSVRPQDDFFRYVNGGWLKKAEIPADASSWGAFQELRENSRTALHELFENSSTANAKAGTPERKVGDLYASYMDSARVEQIGIAPLAPELKSISSLKTSAQLPAVFAHFARLGVQGPAGVFVGADAKHSNENIVQLSQSGLTMPDRDYYLK